MSTYPFRFAFAPRAMSASLLALACALPQVALAETPDDPAQAGADTGATAPHGKVHEETPKEILVVGHPPTDFGLLAATASIGGDELVAADRAQIGDILDGLPGVASTSFAPGASRPILRGFSGDRIRVMTDGLGSLDASNVSVDHAVVFDALTVDHIDVFHGPSVLLYGGNAIGGAVNAIDTRIPRQVPERITATGMGSYGTAADERMLSGKIDMPLGDRFVAHVDGSWRKSDDLRIGGNLYSPALRHEMEHAAEHLAEEGETDEANELLADAGRRGRAPNTAARTYTIGAGLAFIDAGGSLGISYQRYDSRYGIPARPAFEDPHGHEEDGHDDHDDHEEEGHHHDHGEEPVTIDLVQNRFDLRGELILGGLFQSLQLRGGYSDYTHTEYEGTETGTIFDSQAIETRADLVQADRGGWRGRSGAQYFWRKMNVNGPEAVVPDYQIERFGLFTLQSLALGSGFTVDGSGRYESSHVSSRSMDFDKQYHLWSGAAGVSWKSGSGLTLGANFIHGERAPSPEELLSDGIHVATQAYELGDSTLGTERSNGGEAFIRYTSPRFELSLTGYITDFDNYIASVATGGEEDGQPIYQYAEAGALFKGFEAQASFQAAQWSGGQWSIDATSDYTHAKLDDIGPAPRIPPLRLRGGSDLTFGDLHLRGEVEWNAKQDRVGTYENATDDFTLVNLRADWHPMGEEGPVTLMLAANNLFDVIGRRSASYTSDFMPISGRDVRITAKITY
mgnify:CR=1 FL=1